MEILAPVADWEMCVAAVQSGADAIYLGVPGFNARGRATALDEAALEKIITYCHEYKVKVFFAFNVLIFEAELSLVTETIDLLRRLKPDAVIVQDIGLVRLLRAAAPEIAVHASTQMTVTNGDAIALLDELGIKRYVLARELSLAEIRRVRESTAKELEVFVHGALCVSYSGQCLTSERIGGRSANRGQCAQSCRLPYDLIVDGKKMDLGERRYLVSPQDLCGLDEVGELQAIGIESLKIEGRLKSPEYVASTVRSYRTTRDSATANRGELRDELAVLYSRGFFSGWLNGVNHQRLVDGRMSSHHGRELGPVSRISGRTITIATTQSLELGDGLVFADFAAHQPSGKEDNPTEVGGTIYERTVDVAREETTLNMGREFAYASVRPGMAAFLNSAPRVTAAVQRRISDRATRWSTPLELHFTGSPGTPLTVTASAHSGAEISSVGSEDLLVAASTQPLTEASLAAAVGGLSNTPFSVASVRATFSAPVFMNAKAIKALRRDLVAALCALRRTRPETSTLPSSVALRQLQGGSPPARSAPKAPELHVLVRAAEQLDALSGLNVGLVYLDYEFGKQYEPSLAWLRERGIRGAIATTRILKPGEQGHLNLIRRLKPDAVLVRNLGALRYFQDTDLSLVGDFSLNAANSLTVEWLMAQGLQRFTPSYDLNQQQLLAMLGSVDARTAEIVVHQYMPAFHMEHCVFAAFLSTGTSYRDCGRPCEKHQVELRDAAQNVFPLKPDAECRNTMFNGTAQSAARLIGQLWPLGVAHFRIEALNETVSELRQKIERYQTLLGFLHSNQPVPPEFYSSLGTLEQYGVSEGQLFQIRQYRSRSGERSPPH